MKGLLTLFAALLFLTISFAQNSTSQMMDGNKWKEKFRSLTKPENLKEYMKILTAKPHHVGSPYDKENAEWILSKFKEWGWDAKIETFDVLFPSPKERSVELIEPKYYKAKMNEPGVEGDKTSFQQGMQLPTYNAYSKDGEATGELVFVNFGVPKDYEYLERMGISVKGKIVIAKYGGSWRGIKPKVAAEHGAVGCIIYTDPKDDGYFQGDVYPNGPWKPDNGVQRGSVMDMPLYPGDPLTPGIGSTKDAERLPMDEVQTFTKIPVLPISSEDAKPLLESMTGPIAPANWRGSLPITYHLGAGPAKVKMKIYSNWDTKTIFNVIAKIKGSEFPDEWVIRGNHHDAWVNGAVDPISGLVTVLEEARAFGELIKQGWKPKRTLVYCAWDGEEPGLLGSTEWAETHAKELKEKAVIYVNTDVILRGFINMGGSHTLESFINDVTKSIDDPETDLTVWKRRQLNDIKNAKSIEEKNQLRNSRNLKIDALGSGSDYTVFLDHLGIASLNLAFYGEGGYGVYHSIYDDYNWFVNFGDVDFVYGNAAAQTAGTAVMRFADEDILPYNFNDFANTIDSYLTQLKDLARNMRDKITETNKEIDEGIFTALIDPKLPSPAPPKKEEVPPYFNFAPMENAVANLKNAAEKYESTLSEYNKSMKKLPKDFNKKLMMSERYLSSPEGLPQRKWFKNHIYAPGFYTGYGVKTIPIVRETIEEKEWDKVNSRIAKVSELLNNYSKYINSLSDELKTQL